MHPRDFHNHVLELCRTGVEQMVLPASAEYLIEKAYWFFIHHSDEILGLISRTKTEYTVKTSSRVIAIWPKHEEPYWGKWPPKEWMDANSKTD